MHIEVVATRTITEEGFNGVEQHVHAEAGDTGEIIHIGEEGDPVVRFARSGTVTDVALFENAILREAKEK